MSLEDEIRRIVREEIAKERAEAQKTAAAPFLVTVSAYASARSISESTVRQAIAEDRLPITRIGKAIRIAADAVIQRRVANKDEITARARLVLLGGGKAR